MWQIMIIGLNYERVHHWDLQGLQLLNYQVGFIFHNSVPFQNPVNLIWWDGNVNCLVRIRRSNVINSHKALHFWEELQLQISFFLFCQAQLGINVYYREKKIEKVEKQKFKLALKLFKKSWKSRKIQKSLFFKMVDFWHFFAICILYLVFCLCICVFLSFLEQQFLSISASKYSFDDDYDDSGGRTQRDCLSLAAPNRRVSSQTEAKTNTVCSSSTGRNTNTVGVLNGK